MQSVFPKIVLTMLGDPPAVWNVAIVFLQMALVTGLPHAHPGDYYRFTTDSLRTLFEAYSRVELCTYGNSATASGSPQYLMSNHFSNSVLNYHDPVCPSIVAVAAWK